VKLIDLNLLLYSINRDSTHHPKAKTWLESVLSEDEPVALPWLVLLGFLRVSTNHRILPRPLSVEEAISVVDGWLAQPAVRVLHPGDEHWRTLKTILAECGTAGNLTTDAHLAAMAIENGSELCSTDTDFQRFPRLKWTNPLQP
jgi:hypothetical protein